MIEVQYERRTRKIPMDGMLTAAGACGLQNTPPGDKLDISMTLWESTQPSKQRLLESLAEEYAAFRLLNLKKCTIETK